VQQRKILLKRKAVCSSEHRADKTAETDKIEFQGFESLYASILDIEDQLLCSEVQAVAEETFDDLTTSFELFQSKVRAVLIKAKHKKQQKLRQMT
jgi:hypothetical protein